MKSVLLFSTLFAAISMCFFSAEGATLLVEAAKVQDVDVNALKDGRIHPTRPLSAAEHDLHYDDDEWSRHDHDHPAWFDHDDGYHDRGLDHGDRDHSFGYRDRDRDHWLDHDDHNDCGESGDDHGDHGEHDLYGHDLYDAAIPSKEHHP